jgi:short-subunit dehydrogenase
MPNLTDKVIIITGASSGIGAATAVECARAGMDVIITARREDKLKIVANMVENLDRRAAIVVGAVTDKDMTERLLDEALAKFGRFDAVFANAGYGLERPMARTSLEQIREMFEVNVFSGIELLQTAAQQLLESGQPGGGHLLMCSSCLSKFTLPFHGLYAATKAAQNQICRSMRIELEPFGIHVSSVHPITTTTEFVDVSRTRSGVAAHHAPASDHAPRMFVQSPQRVARAVVKCLRKPVPEVWTSHIVRFAAALMTFSPRMTDFIMRRMERDRRQAMSDLAD